MDYDLYKRVVDNLHDGLYFVDNQRRITYWNKSAEKITGFSADEVLGHSCADNILTHVDKNGQNLCLNACPLSKSIQDQQLREAEIFLHHKDGHRIPVAVRVSPLIDETGKIIGGFELFTDISNKQANELRVQELEKILYLDHLTQLCTRAFAEQELESRLEEYQNFGVTFGVLMIDIDYFKNINDKYGHVIGDEILKLVANTFSSCCRPFDLFCRWGGEEFMGIIRNIDSSELNETGDTARQLVNNSYILHEEKILSVTVSIGGTLVKAGDDVKSIIERADQLLYQSKTNGRNLFTLG